MWWVSWAYASNGLDWRSGLKFTLGFHEVLKMYKILTSGTKVVIRKGASIKINVYWSVTLFTFLLVFPYSVSLSRNWFFFRCWELEFWEIECILFITLMSVLSRLIVWFKWIWRWDRLVILFKLNLICSSVVKLWSCLYFKIVQ